MMTRRLVQLFTGLAMYGISLAMFIRAGLGLDPWDVFHQGLANRTGLSIGVVVIAVSFLVLLLWIPLRQKPGVGTLLNVLLVGTAIQATVTVIPPVHGLLLQALVLVAGVLVVALASGLYIGARFGPGPRDGLMTGLARRTGRSIRLTRTCLEVTVLAIGWLLGGTVGVGTVLFAVSIGPLAQLFMRIFDTKISRDRRPNGPARWRTGRRQPRTPDADPRTSAAAHPAIPG